jgi:nuclear GTP-binding protein
VLNDWNSGKIKYFTHPPETVAGDIASEIVSEFAKEFSLDTLDMDNDMDTLPVVRPRYGARKGNTVY